MSGGARRRAYFEAADRRRNLMLEAQARGREDERSLASRLAETERLAVQRGEALERPLARKGEPRRPMRRISGLQWLLARGRIASLQAQAGLRYGQLCEGVTKGDLPSSLKERMGGSPPLTPAEAKLAAVTAKGRADWVLRQGLPDPVGRELVRLCEVVCGQTATVREAAGGDRAVAERMEVELGLALNLLAVHFGLAPPPRRMSA